MKKASFGFSLVFLLCFATTGFAARAWSPERLYTGFERAMHDARSSGGLTTVQGTVAKLVNDGSGPVLVLGNEDTYTVWCYMASGQKLSGVTKGQKKTVRGRVTRKFPAYEAVQMHECSFQ